MSNTTISQLAEAAKRRFYGRLVPSTTLCARITRTLPDVTATSGHPHYSHQLDTDDDLAE